VGKGGQVEYRIELSATFVMDIFSSVHGPPGLDRSAIEDIIERNWACISADKNVLQESSWELVDYVETGTLP
jgi:hypothetical protein